MTAIAATALRAKFAATTMLATRSRLTLAFSSDHSYRLNWQPQTSSSEEWVGPVDDQDHTALSDLMGLIRKNQHISICASQDVEASDRDSGFGDLTLAPNALPNLDWHELDTTVEFLGRKVPVPLLITGMTGGLARGAEINFRLARAAAAYGIPMGVGSQRVALDNPDHAAIFTVKKKVPNLFLIGNVGMAQLLCANPLELCQRAVDMIEADALAIHLNVLQELVQVEGDRKFRGILDQIERIAARLEVPLIVKEVGVGLDPATALKLANVGVAALDCGGKGGTSWSYIEGERASAYQTRAVASTFRDFGIPTAVSLATLRAQNIKLPLIATGGIRDGLMVAKAVGLGATLCGLGLPLLRAALQSEEAPQQILEIFVHGLKIAMMVSGSPNLAALSHALYRGDLFNSEVKRFSAAGSRTGQSW